MMALLNGRARGQLEGQGGGGTPGRVVMLGMVSACATCIAPDSVVAQFHPYEGHSLVSVVYPIHLMATHWRVSCTLSTSWQCSACRTSSVSLLCFAAPAEPHPVTKCCWRPQSHAPHRHQYVVPSIHTCSQPPHAIIIVQDHIALPNLMGLNALLSAPHAPPHP